MSTGFPASIMKEAISLEDCIGSFNAGRCPKCCQHPAAAEGAHGIAVAKIEKLAAWIGGKRQRERRAKRILGGDRTCDQFGPNQRRFRIEKVGAEIVDPGRMDISAEDDQIAGLVPVHRIEDDDSGQEDSHPIDRRCRERLRPIGVLVVRPS